MAVPNLLLSAAQWTRTTTERFQVPTGKRDFPTFLLFGGVFRKCTLPRGLAKEPPKMDLVSVKYKIGASDA